jgi:glycosyltransferase involved in cell wall biosynthesis
VLASEKEGLARCMIEAISCGTPFVSFDVASAREILEQHDCGVVVPEGDYAQLSAAIARLCGNPGDLAAKAGRGIATGRRLFSAETVVSSYIDILRAVSRRGR